MKKFLATITVLMSTSAMATVAFPYSSMTINFSACQVEELHGLSTLRALVADELRNGGVHEYIEANILEGGKVVCIRPNHPTTFNRLKEKIESVSSTQFEVKEREKPCNQLLAEGEI